MTSTTSTTSKICPQVLEDAVKVVFDHRIDAKASTGNFEILHIVPISCFQGQKVELGIAGKKLTVPSMKSTKNLLKTFNNHVNFCIQGKPLKSPYKVSKQTDHVISNKQVKKLISTSNRLSFPVKPFKLYKTPRKPRNILKTILVQPPHSDDLTYVRKLPSISQSSTRKLNLYDLMRCLSIQKDI